MVSNFKFITLFSKLDIKYNNIKLTILQIYVHCTIINSIEVCGYYYLSVMIFLTLFYYSFYTLFFPISLLPDILIIFFSVFYFLFISIFPATFTQVRDNLLFLIFPWKLMLSVRVTHHIWKGKKCPTCVLW